MNYRNAIKDFGEGGKYKLYFKTVTNNFLSTFLTIPPSHNPKGKPVPQTQINNISFSDITLRDASFVFSLSKVSLLWWATTGDGFHLTKSGLSSTPVPSQTDFLLQIQQMAPEFQKALKSHLEFIKKAGNIYGNYDVRQIRHLTDKVDELVLKELGLEDHWTALQLFYACFTKQATNT